MKLQHSKTPVVRPTREDNQAFLNKLDAQRKKDNEVSAVVSYVQFECERELVQQASQSYLQEQKEKTQEKIEKDVDEDNRKTNAVRLVNEDKADANKKQKSASDEKSAKDAAEKLAKQQELQQDLLKTQVRSALQTNGKRYKSSAIKISGKAQSRGERKHLKRIDVSKLVKKLDDNATEDQRQIAWREAESKAQQMAAASARAEIDASKEIYQAIMSNLLSSRPDAELSKAYNDYMKAGMLEPAKTNKERNKPRGALLKRLAELKREAQEARESGQDLPQNKQAFLNIDISKLNTRTGREMFNASLNNDAKYFQSCAADVAHAYCLNGVVPVPDQYDNEDKLFGFLREMVYQEVLGINGAIEKTNLVLTPRQILKQNNKDKTDKDFSQTNAVYVGATKLFIGEKLYQALLLSMRKAAMEDAPEQVGGYVDKDTGVRRSNVEPGKAKSEEELKRIDDLLERLYEIDRLYLQEVSESTNIYNSNTETLDQQWEQAAKELARAQASQLGMTVDEALASAEYQLKRDFELMVSADSYTDNQRLELGFDIKQPRVSVIAESIEQEQQAINGVPVAKPVNDSEIPTAIAKPVPLDSPEYIDLLLVDLRENQAAFRNAPRPGDKSWSLEYENQLQQRQLELINEGRELRGAELLTPHDCERIISGMREDRAHCRRLEDAAEKRQQSYEQALRSHGVQAPSAPPLPGESLIQHFLESSKGDVNEQKASHNSTESIKPNDIMRHSQQSGDAWRNSPSPSPGNSSSRDDDDDQSQNTQFSSPAPRPGGM